MWKRGGRLDFVDVLVFVVPCLQFIVLRVVGVLNGSDLVLLVLFFCLASSRKIRITPRSARGAWTLTVHAPSESV